MGDSSESCSSSGSSYSSSRPGSYRPLVPRPVDCFKRFMQNIRDKFNRMTVTSLGRESQGWHHLETSDSDSDIPLRPLLGVRGGNTQRSVGKTGSDETVRVMNMIIQIPPGNRETIMYEIEDPSSCNNAASASNIKFKDNSLAAIILSNEPAFINLNFPQLDELIESFSETSTSDDGNDENTLDGEADGEVEEDCAEDRSVTHVNGELRVFKSGRATLSFGSKVFVLAKAAKKRYSEKIVCVNIENRLRSLGLVEHYIDVIPQEQVDKETG